ncbi:MAG: hypothetical protein ACR2HD_02460 [Solirubrobacteraceae bacterium]|nr:MAG: hypothetical protein DLM63_03425 [Solirubrobacterales bacterium]
MKAPNKAAKNRAAQANSAAQAIAANPYVQRIVGDEDLRNEVRSAAKSARKAYARLSNGKASSQAILNDKKLQRDLRETADSLRKVSNTLRTAPAKRRSGGLARKLLLLVAVVAIGLAVSEPSRKKVLDALFGAEEEFDYTSTTAPATPAPDPVATS